MIIDSHCHPHDPAVADLKATLPLSMADGGWGGVALRGGPAPNGAAADALEALKHHGVERAVFHWHKAPPVVTRAIIDAGYLVSVTPDLVSRDRDRDLVTGVPLDALLVESDGPWEYGGEFEGIDSGPWLASRVAEEVAKLKHLPVEDVMFQLSINTCRLFDLMWA